MLSVYRGKIAHWSWFEAETVGSTNDEIKKMVPDKGKYIVFSAVHQTKGRGRRGRIWHGLEDNLFFTYSIKIEPVELGRIVCMTGLSLAKTVKKIEPSSQIRIKWPNDVFLEGKKLSGILIENINEDLWAIGIGVNIVSAPVLTDMPYQAVSLRECGISLDRTEFLRYYLNEFAADMELYQQQGFAAIKEQWCTLALNYQQEISIRTETGVKNGKFADIDNNGYLLLKTCGRVERIMAGDVFTDNGAKEHLKKEQKEDR